MPYALSGRVLITGGSGYLARAIYRRAEREKWPAEFTCFSRDDGKHAILARRFPAVRCIRGDVAADRALLTAAMRGHDFVIHAAANKHVPQSETAVFDTSRINIHGSENVFLAALEAGVHRVVAISSDKAVAPLGVYGDTKMLMERLAIEADRFDTGSEFAVVRYGNVVGSTGSLLPVLKAQFARDGYVALTAPAMTRYWMSADEAVDAVLRTFAAPRGTTLVPVCRGMSLQATVDAAIVHGGNVRVIGLRPGEKLHESLIGEAESVRAEFVENSAGADHWLLYPPGEVRNDRPFEETSSRPLGGWVTPEAMRAMSEDSEHV